MTKKPEDYLNKRESQIMDIVYRRGRATVADVCEDLEDIPNYTAARVLLHKLAAKGLLRYERKGRRYYYYPKVAPEKVRKTELSHVVDTFFGGSPEDVMADLLEMSQEDMDDERWQKIYAMIEEARKQGR
jgi:predicted transcriptional regulator